MSYHIEYFVEENGKHPFFEALDNLNEKKTEAKINQAIEKLRGGNLGNVKSLRSGVFEYKINSGPGYRIYFSITSDKILLVFLMGTKGTQTRDIRKSIQYWNNYKVRMNS